MKVQLGTILMNRTKTYLVPVLKAYGEEFRLKFTSLFKLAIGIGDFIVVKSNITLDKHLFILADSQMFNENFINFQAWIREQPMYEDDYAVDNIRTGHLHMFVIKFPVEYLKVFETFKKSEYSKMFTKEELELFFEDEHHTETKKILIKDHNYKVVFAKKLAQEFGVPSVSEKDIKDSNEFDLPIEDKEEIFNYQK